MLMSRPAGMCAVPEGDTAVCQAGTSFTQPQSNVTVPPKFGSRTSSMPASAISLASSTMATTVAPVRLAMSTVSPRWSAWPCVSRMTSGFSSLASAAATGLWLRNGSVTTFTSPVLISKQDCPRNRMSTAIGRAFRRVHQGVGELVPNCDAGEHADARLLLHERPHRLLTGGRVLHARRGAHGAGVRLVEPAGGVERL